VCGVWGEEDVWQHVLPRHPKSSGGGAPDRAIQRFASLEPSHPMIVMKKPIPTVMAARRPLGTARKSIVRRPEKVKNR
jgi:hypothetical protein